MNSLSCENCIYFKEEQEELIINATNNNSYTEKRTIFIDYCYTLPNKLSIDNRKRRVCSLYMDYTEAYVALIKMWRTMKDEAGNRRTSLAGTVNDDVTNNGSI